MPTDAEKVQASILKSAEDGIQNHSNDAGSTTILPISEQIKAANYLAGVQASKNKTFGLRFSKIIPPGAG